MKSYVVVLIRSALTRHLMSTHNIGFQGKLRKLTFWILIWHFELHAYLLPILYWTHPPPHHTMYWKSPISILGKSGYLDIPREKWLNSGDPD